MWPLGEKAAGGRRLLRVQRGPSPRSIASFPRLRAPHPFFFETAVNSLHLEWCRRRTASRRLCSTWVLQSPSECLRTHGRPRTLPLAGFSLTREPRWGASALPTLPLCLLAQRSPLSPPHFALYGPHLSPPLSAILCLCSSLKGCSVGPSLFPYTVSTVVWPLQPTSLSALILSFCSQPTISSVVLMTLGPFFLTAFSTFCA